MKNDTTIIKRSLKSAVFIEDKLRHSLERSGASDSLIEKIIIEVKNILYEGISTKEIYKKAFSMLKKEALPAAGRYKLKKAILELGPTGYPFEKFVAALLQFQSYEIQVGTIVQGHCVAHEVDVIAEKNNSKYIVECKFHSDSSRHCNVKIPLYIQSRFVDIKKEWMKKSSGDKKQFQGWIFTNTRFTKDAIQYANCSNLKLTAWSFPKEGSLKERIDLSGLHPITCLSTITMKEKEQLLKREVVLCKSIITEPDVLNLLNIKEIRKKKIMKEIKELCRL